MDAILADRWKSTQVPFDGDCLRFADLVPINSLRVMLISWLSLLQDRTQSMPIYQFDDWHEHDGFITLRHETTWVSIENLLVDDDAFFAARHGDDYIYCAFYPADCSFLLRFYLQEMDNDPSYHGKWGDCDLCASPSLLRDAHTELRKSLNSSGVIENAKKVFDSIYAG